MLAVLQFSVGSEIDKEEFVEEKERETKAKKPCSCACD